ncbi:hypothetical protein HY30_11040 [Hyphomonas chukchiensis]|uniref:FHA domain-containing protein n=2 Tax=Hyphomonas chukchiensis TaxID=1280947 RepID=A0A062UBH1_9PROT|nr:hypothetical protein HY30_11040 [Hyphomonas chukchiensis]
MKDNFMKVLTGIPLAALLFAAPVSAASAQSIVYHSGMSHAETCAERVSDPQEQSAYVLRLCKTALTDESLSPASRAATLTNTGIMEMRQGSLDAAVAHFQAARAVDAASPDVAINLGAALIRLGRFQEAIDVLHDPQAISVGHRHIAYYNRAIAHWAVDDVALAYEDLSAANALRPDYDAARELLQHFQVAEVN